MQPPQVCFLGPQSYQDGLFWVNRIVDVIFFIDMLCQFYIIPSGEIKYLSFVFIASLIIVLTDFDTNNIEPDEICSGIRANYVRGWFLLDILALLPYDFIVYGIQKLASGSNLEMLRLLRVVRLLRLGKASKE